MIVKKWLRKCQECSYKGFYQKPNLDSRSEAWRETKCRKCKSESLDFGREVEVDEATNQIVEEE